MKLKKLGNTGVLVSEICLGTMTFGSTADEETSKRILTEFEEKGGNFIDTANVYSSGKSEEIIGKWLQGMDRERLFIATKARFRTADHPNGVGLSRKHILHAVDESLKRMQTDYIDILQVHAWDPITPLEETYQTLNSLVENGTIRYVGISNYRGWQFEKALQLCRARGWSEPVCLQPNYNILTRATEFELLPMARAENIAVIPWSPLAGGILSGKYGDELSKAEKGTRIGDASSPEYYTRFRNERTSRVIKLLKRISQEHGKTMSQVALNWLLCNPAVTSPIIGARNTEQLSENIGATGWNLGENEISEINEASSLDTTYPYDIRSEEQQSRDRVL